ncbi:hypothetical protein ACN28G_17225 [Micromonospora sp. WMMA1923]
MRAILSFYDRLTIARENLANLENRAYLDPTIPFHTVIAERAAVEQTTRHFVDQVRNAMRNNSIPIPFSTAEVAAARANVPPPPSPNAGRADAWRTEHGYASDSDSESAYLSDGNSSRAGTEYTAASSTAGRYRIDPQYDERQTEPSPAAQAFYAEMVSYAVSSAGVSEENLAVTDPSRRSHRPGGSSHRPSGSSHRPGSSSQRPAGRR